MNISESGRLADPNSRAGSCGGEYSGDGEEPPYLPHYLSFLTTLAELTKAGQD
jgi:hypothetical protein